MWNNTVENNKAQQKKNNTQLDINYFEKTKFLLNHNGE